MTPERARLFVALELPEPIREALHTWAEAPEVRDDTWRPLAPSSLHVTLCFLGSQPAGEIDAIGRACAAAVSEPGALAVRRSGESAVSEPGGAVLTAPVLNLAAALTLPPRRPRVLAVALDDPGGTLAVIQSRLASALAAAGWYEPERRPYLPHVTVARARRGARVEVTAPAAQHEAGPQVTGRAKHEARSQATARFQPPPDSSFVATTISLLRSRPGEAGSRYERLAAVELSRDNPARAAANQSTSPARARSHS